jgi:hypothetical protein
VPARAACPFDPQEQTSSGYTLRSVCAVREFGTAKYSTLFGRPVDDGTAALIRVQITEVSSGSAIIRQKERSFARLLVHRVIPKAIEFFLDHPADIPPA